MSVKIDSVAKRLNLPLANLEILRAMRTRYSNKEKITKRELQVLVGHMTFAAKAIYGARLFSRIFIDVLTALESPSHHTRIAKLLQSELLWWKNVSGLTNGMVDCKLELARSSIVLHTDACLEGFWAVLDGDCIAGTWKDNNDPFWVGVMSNNWLASPVIDECIA